MGTKIGAIAFPRANRSRDEVIKIVDELIKTSKLEPDDFYPEIRIDITDSLVVIINFPALEVMVNISYWEDIFRNLNISNEWLVTLAYFNFCDCYGYTIYEQGKHLRTLAYYEDYFEVNPLLIGVEQPFENKYLHQPICYLNTENDTVVESLDNLDIYEQSAYIPAVIIDGEAMSLDTAYSCLFSECSLKYLGADLSYEYVEGSDSLIIPINEDFETELKQQINENFETELKQKFDEKKGSSLLSKILNFFK